MSKQIAIAGDMMGLETRNRAFLLPNGAYPTLFNAYERRQRIRKKRGHTTRGRLRRCLTTIVLNQSAAGVTTTINDLLLDPNVLAFGATPVRTAQPNAEIQHFVTGLTPVLTITVGADMFTDNGNGTLTGGSGGATINYVSGQIVLNFFPPIPVTPITVTFCYYPALPVMGIIQQETIAINAEQTVAFDTTYAYIPALPVNNWIEMPSAAPTFWTGADFNLFWGVNYRGTVPQTQALWVTNNVDPIRYYETGTWNAIPFLPILFGTTVLSRALLIAPFKGRLLVFNTTETDTVAATSATFVNRCRYSRSALVGNPTNLAAGWLQVPQGGGFVDAPTAEAIISVQNLKDRLIVYFERSTWELVYTGNETLPFYFRKINRELGSESTFSVIPFDGGVLGIGNVGIHACNGTNVTRIDEKIPDQVYTIHNEEQGPQRVSGIRDFVEEVVYWTYPDFSAYDPDVDFANRKFPNRVLLYNYTEGTWGILEESFTCYGYYQPAVDYTWNTLPYVNWDAWTVPWNGGISQARVLKVLAGNQQGYTLELTNDSAANAVSRAIRAFPTPTSITSPDHNMHEGDYFIISGAIGVVFAFNPPFNGPPYNYTPALNSFRVTNIPDKDTLEFDGNATGAYLGGGEITVLSNFNIRSKTFNEFFPLAQSIRFPYADFLFDRQANGFVSVYFYLNDNQSSRNRPLQGTSAMPLGGLALNPLEALQNTIWYRKFANAVGQFVQYQLRHSDDDDLQYEPDIIPQMRVASIPQIDFVLNAVVLTADPSGRLAP